MQHKCFYFVGPTRATTAAGSADVAWLFEFGFGESLVVLAARLLSHGRPFSLANQLFLGDRITRFAFREMAGPDGEYVLALDLLDVVIEVQRSSAWHLYNERKHFSVVHALRLEWSNGKPRIAAIDGCGDEMRPTRSHRVRRARPLGFESPAEQGEEERTEQVAYGRLDFIKFEDTHGADLHFHHVRLSLGFDALEPGEVVFLQALRIDLMQSGNDCFLRLGPLSGVAPCDADDEFALAGVGVSRRRFSKREFLLRRIEREPGAFARLLQGQVFAIRVYREGTHLSGLIYGGMPERRLRALHAWLQHRDEPTFGVVLENFEGRLSIELRPGIFFPLEEGKFDLPREARQPGAIVRLEARPQGQFAGYASSFAVSIFFQKRRPAVALPFDSSRNAADLAAAGEPWWRQAEYCFTLGDFPEVTCKPVSVQRRGQRSQLVAPASHEWLPFMERSHPRIAWAQASAAENATLAPAHRGVTFGSLSSASLIEALFVPAAECETAGQALGWCHTSFADVPVKELQMRCARGWRYHDASTVVWGRGRPEWLPQHSPTTGPLFFEDDEHGGLRLRYRWESLFHHGLALGDPLERFGAESWSLAVAGSVKLDGRAVGVWVEFAPGRVHLLPAEMLTWRCAGHMLSLGKFDCEHFCVGDELRLQAAGGATLEPGFVELCDWRRSTRALLGDRFAFLPVAAIDQGKGALTLGAGRFLLTLPVADVPLGAGACWVDGENHLSFASSESPFPGDVRGDTCLLGFDAEERNLIVLGAQDWQARPHRDAAWAEHPVRCSIDEPDAIRRRVHRLVRAVGALPATIEGVDWNHRTIYFSFRKQTPQIAAGCFTFGKIVGLEAPVDASPEVLIWVGRGLLRAPFHDVLGGVSAELQLEAGRLLVETGAPVPIRVDAEGSLQFYLSEEQPGEMRTVEPIVIVADPKDPLSWGLITRSSDSARLVWVPSERAAWARITRLEAERHLLRAHHLLVVRLLAAAHDQIIGSLTDTDEAQREGKALRVGAPLRAVAIAGGEDGRALACSPATNLLVLLRAATPPPMGRLFAAVVDKRQEDDGSVFVEIVPADEWIRALALPQSISGEEFARFTDCLDEALRHTLDDSTLTRATLEEQLCQAWVRAREGKNVARYSALLVAAWPRPHEETNFLRALLCLSTLALLESEAPGTHWASLLEKLDDLGRRALRSLHVELHASHGQTGSLGGWRSERLLQQLHALLQSPLRSREFEALRRWTRLSRLSLRPETRSVAAAIACSTGDSARWVCDACLGAEILGKIVGLRSAAFSLIVSRRRHPPVPKFAELLAGELELLIRRVTIERIDLRLLAALPEMMMD